jgi:hypothetical protein
MATTPTDLKKRVQDKRLVALPHGVERRGLLPKQQCQPRLDGVNRNHEEHPDDVLAYLSVRVALQMVPYLDRRQRWGEIGGGDWGWKTDANIKAKRKGRCKH